MEGRGKKGGGGPRLDINIQNKYAVLLATTLLRLPNQKGSTQQKQQHLPYWELAFCPSIF